MLQVVSDFDDVDAEFGLFRSMAEASGRPLSFSLAGIDPAKYPRQLELLDQANATACACGARPPPGPSASWSACSAR